MKKLIPFIFVIFSGAIAFAQTPTLDSASYGLLINNSLHYYVADSNATDKAGTSGSGVTWDYSQLQGYGNVVIDSVLAPSATSYGSAFPSSYGCDSLEDNSLNYYHFKTSDTLIIDGYSMQTGAGDVVATMDNDKQIVMIYPFTYQSMFTDTFSGNATLPSLGNATYNGKITVEGDGEGTLKLPNSVTYNDVLRVKVVEDAVAETTGFPPFTIYVLRTKYLYYTNSSKFPVLRHETMQLSGDFSSTVSTVYSRDPLLPMGIEESSIVSNSVSVYPNPTNDGANIQFSLESGQQIRTTLNDLLGNTVKVVGNKTYTAGTHKLKVNTGDLPGGLYFINIRTGNEQITKKLIVN